MGTKILLLPGLDGDGFYLAAIHKTLERFYPVMRFSYPHELRNYEDLCAWVVDQLDTDSDYILFAESFGGPLAIRIAEVLEKQAKAVIFCATFCEPPLPRFILSAAAALYPYFIPFDWMAHFLNFFLCNGSALAVAKQLHGKLKRTPDKVIAHRIRLLKGLDMRGASAVLDCPCLVISALHDRLVWYSRFSQLGDARFATIDGPHGLAGLKPNEVAETALGFITALPPPPKNEETLSDSPPFRL